MKKIPVTSVLLICLMACLCSCKKSDEECKGGTGGNLTLKVYLQHGEHGVVNLKNYRDTVFLKYNTQEYPGSNPSLYDQTIIGDWPGDCVTVNGLHCGDYFIYATGYESVHGYRVAGGIPFSTKQKEGETSVTVPVSE